MSWFASSTNDEPSAASAETAEPELVAQGEPTAEAGAVLSEVYQNPVLGLQSEAQSGDLSAEETLWQTTEVQSGDLSAAPLFAELGMNVSSADDIMNGNEASLRESSGGGNVADSWYEMCVYFHNMLRAREALAPYGRVTAGEECSDALAEYDEAKNAVHGAYQRGVQKFSECKGRFLGSETTCPGYHGGGAARKNSMMGCLSGIHYGEKFGAMGCTNPQIASMQCGHYQFIVHGEVKSMSCGFSKSLGLRQQHTFNMHPGAKKDAENEYACKKDLVKNHWRKQPMTGARPPADCSIPDPGYCEGEDACAYDYYKDGCGTYDSGPNGAATSTRRGVTPKLHECPNARRPRMMSNGKCMQREMTTDGAMLREAFTKELPASACSADAGGGGGGGSGSSSGSGSGGSGGGSTTPQQSVSFSGQTLKATHFWDCNGGSCDAKTLTTPWSNGKNRAYRYAAWYAPLDPRDFGGPTYGEKMWMTGAFSDALSAMVGSDDGCCGQDGDGKGGCGRCLLVRAKSGLAKESSWTAVVMKKNRCPPWSHGCDKPHLDIAVPGYDNLQYSTANICGQEGTHFSTKAASAICGDWYKRGGDTSQGCDCSSMPEETEEQRSLKLSCALFTRWGWKRGDPDLEYAAVECPVKFKEIMSKAFGSQGATPSWSGPQYNGPAPWR